MIAPANARSLIGRQKSGAEVEREKARASARARAPAPHAVPNSDCAYARLLLLFVSGMQPLPSRKPPQECPLARCTAYRLPAMAFLGNDDLCCPAHGQMGGLSDEQAGGQAEQARPTDRRIETDRSAMSSTPPQIALSCSLVLKTAVEVTSVTTACKERSFQATLLGIARARIAVVLLQDTHTRFSQPSDPCPSSKTGSPSWRPRSAA